MAEESRHGCLQPRTLHCAPVPQPHPRAAIALAAEGVRPIREYVRDYYKTGEEGYELRSRWVRVVGVVVLYCSFIERMLLLWLYTMLL